MWCFRLFTAVFFNLFWATAHFVHWKHPMAQHWQRMLENYKWQPNTLCNTNLVSQFVYTVEHKADVLAGTDIQHTFLNSCVEEHVKVGTFQNQPEVKRNWMNASAEKNDAWHNNICVCVSFTLVCCSTVVENQWLKVQKLNIRTTTKIIQAS